MLLSKTVTLSKNILKCEKRTSINSSLDSGETRRRQRGHHGHNAHVGGARYSGAGQVVRADRADRSQPRHPDPH